MNIVNKNKQLDNSVSKEEYDDAIRQLCSLDSVMDESIFDSVQTIISYNLSNEKKCRNIDVNSSFDNRNQSQSIMHKYILECLDSIVENYVGFAPVCEVLSEWIGILDEIPDFGDTFNSSVSNSSFKSKPSSRKRIKVQKHDSNSMNNNITLNMIEPLAHLIERYFNTEALRKYMDENRDLLGQGGWQPPPCYWSLMKHPVIVNSIQKLFARNRKSEFLLAFLQDLHNFSRINPNIEYIPKNINYSSTSNFSVFTKNVTELLADFLLTDETVEAALQGTNSLPLSGTADNPLLSLNRKGNSGDGIDNSIIHDICSTFSQSENAYFYAQALLHYMIVWRGDYSGCRRLSQMLYHYVRVTLREPRVAQLSLLFTNLTNFPELFKLCKSIFKMEIEHDDGDKSVNGGLGGFESAVRFQMNPNQISNLYDILKGIIDRFESLQILLYERERLAKCGNKTSSASVFNKDVTTDFKIEEQSLTFEDINNINKWESLGTLGSSLNDLELNNLSEYSHKKLDICNLSFQNKSELNKGQNDSSQNADTNQNIQQLMEVSSLNHDTCSMDETIFDMPSVSRMGDVPGSDEIKRLKTGPERPPMDALRESALLETLIDMLANQNIWLTPEEQSKTIDLLLLLSVYSPYELLLFLEEQKEWCTFPKESHTNCDKADIWGNSEDEIDEGRIKGGIETLSDFISSGSSNSERTFSDSDVYNDDNSRLQKNNQGTSNVNAISNSLVEVEQRNSTESTVGCKSTIDSCIYRNAHTQKILGSLQSLSKSQAKKMREQFKNLRDLCDRYKYKARRELFSIYHIIHDNLIKDDLKWAYLDSLITTPIGASTILRYTEVFLFSGSQGHSPLILLSSSILVILKHIAQCHPKKRICIFHLLRLCLEHDLHESNTKNNCTVKSLMLTKSEKRRWIIDFFVYLIGGGLYNSVLAYMSQVGIKYLDKSLIRDFTTKLSEYCGPPYSVDFSISLLSFLTSAHELEALDLISFCEGNSGAPHKVKMSIIEVVTVVEYLESTHVSKGKQELSEFLLNRTGTTAHLKRDIQKIMEKCKILKQVLGKSVNKHMFRGKGLGKTWYQSY